MMSSAPASRTTQTRLIAIGIRQELKEGQKPCEIPSTSDSRSVAQGMRTETDGGTNDLTNGKHELPARHTSVRRSLT